MDNIIFFCDKDSDAVKLFNAKFLSQNYYVCFSDLYHDAEDNDVFITDDNGMTFGKHIYFSTLQRVEQTRLLIDDINNKFKNVAVVELGTMGVTADNEPNKYKLQNWYNVKTSGSLNTCGADMMLYRVCVTDRMNFNSQYCLIYMFAQLLRSCNPQYFVDELSSLCPLEAAVERQRSDRNEYGVWCQNSPTMKQVMMLDDPEIMNRVTANISLETTEIGSKVFYYILLKDR